MRKRKSTIVIPPHNGELFPHRAFPPWIALTRVFDNLADALKRSPEKQLDHLEVPLIDASRRIAVIAGGDMPVQQWHRRIGVAIAYCERARNGIPEYVDAGVLTPSEGEAIGEAIDETIMRLVDVAARADIPDEVRATLPELRRPTPRLLH
jgi:hypothetical protein